MILCISAIHQPAQVDKENDGATAPRPFLELTDGWYRINAEIDDCLARAISKGKIAVGRKLAVSGARVSGVMSRCELVLMISQLDSGSDGSEVLDALDKSRLIISANSTALARWHTSLGLHPRPFIAGLSKLSVDGGAIVLMDVVIEKVYPLAFLPTEKGDRTPPWNEAEERARDEKWRVSSPT